MSKHEIDYLTRQLAETADELAYWKYQAGWYRAYSSTKPVSPNDVLIEAATKVLEKGYPDNPIIPYKPL